MCVVNFMCEVICEIHLFFVLQYIQSDFHQLYGPFPREPGWRFTAGCKWLVEHLASKSNNETVGEYTSSGSAGMLWQIGSLNGSFSGSWNSFWMKLKILLDYYLKGIFCQAACVSIGLAQRIRRAKIFAHDGFSSDFGILAREPRFGRLRGSQIHKIGCCRTSLGSHDS